MRALDGPLTFGYRYLVELGAIILAIDETSRVEIAGLSARERATRVAGRVGARRVVVVERLEELAAARGELAAMQALLVLRADQLVHTPLAAPLVETLRSGEPAPLAIAVSPGTTDYAGALLATGEAVEGVLAALLRGESDRTIAARAERRVPHGAVACHPIATPEQRRGAHRLLYQLMVKPQDNVITRYLYRPIAAPLTKLLARTPVTPNQISYTVAVLVAIGCWLTLQGTYELAVAGAGVILLSSYLDCCDGEIARIKLMSSRLGAWIDTVVDELSTGGYMFAIGYHCHLVFGPTYFGADVERLLGASPWLVATVLVTTLYVWCVYAIYYNIIVAVGSANSQDYVGRFEVAPGSRPDAVRLRPKTTTAVVVPRDLPGPVKGILEFAPNIVRRDFICWCSFAFACLGWTHVTFAVLFTGTVVTTFVLLIDHVKLRRLRRSIARSGQILESPAR